MIDCNIVEWPIVKMHFGSHSSYEDVIAWLKQCDKILEKKQKFIIISTFDDNYQFGHEARIQQAKWFKSVKPELKKWCLSMLRVTQDPIIIKKIRAPAMDKGMPFKCIAVDNISLAWEKASQILLKREFVA
ncbi:hypothetical protein FLM55_01275 [Francisella sp. Scap27]|uniref:hypothetical protein n=1 Tax=Francisella sp. Scap27 TaxID=2589986 RepID=UPI0015BE537D|nr:hypothetical protein [Francisella sp. Scap27]QLE78443.1 hypothetical protein FLM55_01275 [Francisella sp. Scap27]